MGKKVTRQILSKTILRLSVTQFKQFFFPFQSIIQYTARIVLKFLTRITTTLQTKKFTLFIFLKYTWSKKTCNTIVITWFSKLS